IKLLRPIVAQIFLNALVLFVLRQMAKVDQPDSRWNIAMDLLHRLINILPAKCNPENLMTVKNLLPGLLKKRKVDFKPKAAGKLLYVNRFLRHQAINQQPLLHGRKVQDLLNGSGDHLRTVQNLLSFDVESKHSS